MSLFPQPLTDLASAVLETARKKGFQIVTAESCTGGLVSGCLTEIPGASDVVDRGFITYSNDAKMQHLDVSRKTILDYGAVSSETALEMAEGALQSSHANIAVAITGIAGPTGGTDEKPVGRVYICIANGKNNNVKVMEKNFDGDRSAVRMAATETALHALKDEMG